jgi:Ca2+-binding RTX toxin-like protein
MVCVEASFDSCWLITKLSIEAIFVLHADGTGQTRLTNNIFIDGNDLVFGGPGNDVIDGQLGSDLLFGEGGSDVLDGGPGYDGLIGGTGLDTCVRGADGAFTRQCE